jgi:hypothetical protein
MRTSGDTFVFSLNRAEKKALIDVLGLYPLVPASHQRLSKTVKGVTATEGQHLLEEALADQREANKGQIRAWLAAPKRFETAKRGSTLTVGVEDSEWLMQVLNDIRIGSWLLLGSPAETVAPEDVPDELASLWASMEISGFFQMTILHAIEGHPDK